MPERTRATHTATDTPHTAQPMGILGALTRLPNSLKLGITGAVLASGGVAATPTAAEAAPGNPGGCVARIDYVHMSSWSEDTMGLPAAKVNAYATCSESVDFLKMRVDLYKLRSWGRVSKKASTEVSEWFTDRLTDEDTWRACDNDGANKWYGKVTFTGVVDGQAYQSISRSPIRELPCGA